MEEESKHKADELINDIINDYIGTARPPGPQHLELAKLCGLLVMRQHRQLLWHFRVWKVILQFYRGCQAPEGGHSQPSQIQLQNHRQ